MKPTGLLFTFIFIVHSALAAGSGLVAAKPLYRDPVYDGAADPTVI